MNWSDTTKRKLEMLLPRLASDQDGEIVSTVKAIDRLIRKEGRDWHDLTAALTGKAQQQTRQTHHQEPPKSSWHEKAVYCAAREEMLSGREIDFVHDMAAKLKWIGTPTPKQAAWLDAIYSRIKRYENDSASA